MIDQRTGREVTVRELSQDKIELIKHTVAIGATDNELALFLYQANKRGLDPLLRQIHFIKRKQFNPDTEKWEPVGTIQTGIDGFRLIAQRTGKLSGIKRGIQKDAGGKLIGAWAEVYRKDWTEPAREEVSFNEYCQRTKEGEPRNLWKTMPETMIKKVAEAAALRMAFPEDLSGIYTHDEMQQADIEVVPITAKALPERTSDIRKLVEAQTQGNVRPDVETLGEKVKEKVESGLKIDMDWFNESCKKIKWTDGTIRSWVKTNLKVENVDMSVENLLSSLTEAQQTQVHDKIQSLLSLK